jgi:large subunit ribosomal protein L29
MKIAEIRAMTDDQLKQKLFDLKKEAMNLRFQMASGQQKDTSLTRSVRRNVARVRTAFTERQAVQQELSRS